MEKVIYVEEKLFVPWTSLLISKSLLFLKLFHIHTILWKCQCKDFSLKNKMHQNQQRQKDRYEPQHSSFLLYKYLQRGSIRSLLDASSNDSLVYEQRLSNLHCGSFFSFMWEQCESIVPNRYWKNYSRSSNCRWNWILHWLTLRNRFGSLENSFTKHQP